MAKMMLGTSLLRTALVILLLLMTYGCQTSSELSETGVTPGEQSNAPGDLSPSPEEILQEAGIDLTIPAMAAVVRDEQAENELRYWAAIALGRTGNEQVLPVLAEALNASNPDVRYGAVVGMGSLSTATAIPHLRSALDDSDPGVRSVAVQTLGQIGGSEAMAALADVVRDEAEPDIGIRMDAAFQLGHLGDPAASEPLRSVVRSGPAELRAAAAIALAELEDGYAVSALVEFILGPSTEEWLREDAVEALESLTGQDFGFVKRYSAPMSSEEHADALRRINKWWQAHQTEYPAP